MLKRWLFVFMLFLVLPVQTLAKDIPERPTTAGYVFDYEEVIDAEVEAEINEIAKLLQSEGIMELMVVTVPTIGELDPYEYGLQFFREWGIGDTEKNNGMLIYATTDMGPNKNVIRISTGYGIEGDYPDSMTNALIQDYMKESLKAGDYTQAFANVVDAIRDMEGIDYTWQGEIIPLVTVDEPTEEYSEEEGFVGNIFGIIFLIVGSLVGLGILGIILFIVFSIGRAIFRKLQEWVFDFFLKKFNKDIRTKGYIRYQQKKEEERLALEAELERKRIEKEKKEAEYLAMLTAGAITQSEYDEKMAKLLGVSTYGSYEAPYDNSSYDSSSSSDDYSYGGGDSGGGGSDDRF